MEDCQNDRQLFIGQIAVYNIVSKALQFTEIFGLRATSV